MEIERIRYIIVRNNRTEIFCGASKNHSFEKIEEQLKDINFYLRETMWDLRGHLEDLNEVYKIIEEQNTKTIKNVDNFKRELKRDNLYTEELENFINQYMIYYNN